MQYRTFSRLDWQPWAPTIDRDPQKIDEPEATRMSGSPFDHGVNHLDTAYSYDQQLRERFLGQACQDGPPAADQASRQYALLEGRTGR